MSTEAKATSWGDVAQMNLDGFEFLADRLAGEDRCLDHDRPEPVLLRIGEDRADAVRGMQPALDLVQRSSSRAVRLGTPGRTVRWVNLRPM